MTKPRNDYWYRPGNITRSLPHLWVAQMEMLHTCVVGCLSTCWCIHPRYTFTCWVTRRRRRHHLPRRHRHVHRHVRRRRRRHPVRNCPILRLRINDLGPGKKTPQRSLGPMVQAIGSMSPA
jgi:hypothetical protein